MDRSSVEGIVNDFSARILLCQLRGNRTVVNEEKWAGQEDLFSSPVEVINSIAQGLLMQNTRMLAGYAMAIGRCT